jgi:hypothetical protein
LPLSPPPVDNEGIVTPHDHPDLTSDDVVVHRISELWVVQDKGVTRLTSMAFKPSTRGKYPGMSVDIAKSIDMAGLDLVATVTSPKYTASIQFVVGDLRGAGLQVGYEPTDENPHHGEVWGVTGKSEPKLRSFAQCLVPLPGVQILKP